MKEVEFAAIIEELTPKQRKVLQGFLAGENDDAIAASLYLEAATVRRHLANVCKRFNLHNQQGEHYSHRDDLLELFKSHRPQWVNPALLDVRGIQGLEPEFPGSPLAVNSRFYIKRSPIEERCVEEIRKPGALIRLRAPRRLGKTSLLHRLMAQGKTWGCRTVYLNFQQADPRLLARLDDLLQWFCLNIARKLGIVSQLRDYWDERFGSIISCSAYFQGDLLPQLSQGLFLVLDNVDWLFEAPEVARGFFALLRSWYEEANNLEVWQQLKLAIAHSTEVYIPLDFHQSPFNVGFPVHLPEFTAEQVQRLAHQYQLNDLQSQVQRLTRAIGGHPYLVQLALYHLRHRNLTLETLLKTAPTQSGIYSNHLRRHWQLLKEHPELQAALKEAIASEEGTELDPILAYKLESLGLVRLRGNLARVSCELYRQFWRDRLS